MRKLLLIVTMLLAPATAIAAQDKTPAPARAPDENSVVNVAHINAAADALALTPEEVKEATALFQSEQARRTDVLRIVDEALSAPYDSEHALIIFGKLREAGANLRTIQAQRFGVLDKQRSTRPDCGECNYDPTLKRLVRPEKK